MPSKSIPSWQHARAAFATVCGCMLACGGSTGPSPASPLHSPWDNEEAEFLAILISDERQAPRAVYDRVVDELEQIRGLWGDSIPSLRTIVHVPFYEPGKLILGPDATTFSRIQNGTYRDWDSLNTLYQLAVVSLFVPTPSVHLQSSVHVNWKSLVRDYTALPGMLWAEPNVRAGDMSNVYARPLPSGRGYLFRDGWSDCIAGCIYWHYWYYRAIADSIEYVGNFGDLTGTREPRPDWWSEAQVCEEIYYDRSILDSIPGL